VHHGDLKATEAKSGGLRQVDVDRWYLDTFQPMKYGATEIDPAKGTRVGGMDPEQRSVRLGHLRDGADMVVMPVRGEDRMHVQPLGRDALDDALRLAPRVDDDGFASLP
jgi:hypothetical protein